MRRSPDNDLHVKNYRIFKRSGRANVTYNFRLAYKAGSCDHKVQQNIFKPLLRH